MKTVLFICAMVLWSSVGLAQQAWRFGLPVQVLDHTNSVAQPGNVRVPLSTNGSLEVINWQTASATSNESGEFILKLVQPLNVGTVIGYEPGEVSFMVSNQWRRLPPGSEEGRKLQILPLPPAEVIEALKFTVPAKETRADNRTEFRATLPYVTLLPVRLFNTATDAKVTASSTQKGSSAQSLVDGEINPHKNFSTAKRGAGSTNSSPEWAQLSWDRPQAFRGLAWFRGTQDPGIAGSKIEAFTATNDLPSTWTTNGWLTVPGRSTASGAFCANQFFVAMRSLSTRALRISTTGEVSQIGVGEVAVLRELGFDPAPSGKKKSTNQ